MTIRTTLGATDADPHRERVIDALEYLLEVEHERLSALSDSTVEHFARARGWKPSSASAHVVPATRAVPAYAPPAPTEGHVPSSKLSAQMRKTPVAAATRSALTASGHVPTEKLSAQLGSRTRVAR